MAKIGYLPLYVEMYDKSSPAIRPRINAFCAEIRKLLQEQGNEIVSADVCRLKNEFETAVDLFEKENVDCIVTIHLAYSPSLESCFVLAKTSLPILVLDTTPTFCFDYNTDSAEIMHNHGIHGVQDMCCMLRRLKKEYSVFAGHYLQSNVISEISNAAKAISCARKLKNGIKVGMIGKPFKGMGDFVVEEAMLNDLGITKILCDGNDLANIVENIDEKELLNSLKSSRYEKLMALALYTGLRPNELATARVEGEFIVAKNSKRKGGKIEYKKIPISSMLKPYFEKDNEIDMPGVEYLRDQFNKILPNHIFYDLRTTFYTRCEECGVAPPARDHFVGHSSSVLNKTYTSLSDEYLLQEGQKLVW